MKALELTIYPKRQVATGFVRWNGDGTTTDLHVEEWLVDGEWLRSPFMTHKRLTDAELAAECWRAKWTGLWAEHNSGLNDRRRAMIATVERFATLPHYDETGTP